MIHTARDFDGALNTNPIDRTFNKIVFIKCNRDFNKANNKYLILKDFNSVVDKSPIARKLNGVVYDDQVS